MSQTNSEFRCESGRLHRAFDPVIAPLLRSRWISLPFAVGGSLQVAAALAHVPGMPCPFLQLFHFPCPGCGLSRACAATLHANIADSVRLHAFATPMLLAIGLFWLGALLPHRKRLGLASWMDRFERRTWVPTLLLIGLLLYWAVRLLYAPAQFTRLVAG